MSSINKITAEKCIKCGSDKIQIVAIELFKAEDYWMEVTAYDCPDCENIFGIITDRGVYFNLYEDLIVKESLDNESKEILDNKVKDTYGGKKDGKE